MFKFRNIDGFTPGRFERMGMLKGKRWYINSEDAEVFRSSISVLFKPKRKEFGDKKVYCANHYGELVGYLLSLSSRTSSCKVELAQLSRYYENIHKERNNGTPEQKEGCIIYSHLERNQVLEHGKLVVENYINEHPEIYSISRSELIDNIDVFINSVEYATRGFYQRSSIKRSSDFIDEKVLQNRRKAINMIIYDCLYGNNDRHDENWALVKDLEGRDIDLYPLYDNERVLGLYENIRTIEYALNNDNVESESEKILFSRMRVPGEKNKNSSYKDVLRYMLDTYPETQEIISQHLKSNTPRNVRMYLESCEGLPKQYVTFGTKMYESRYNFAKELIMKHKNNENKNHTKSFQENPDDLENR